MQAALLSPLASLANQNVPDPTFIDSNGKLFTCHIDIDPDPTYTDADQIITWKRLTTPVMNSEVFKYCQQKEIESIHITGIFDIKNLDLLTDFKKICVLDVRSHPLSAVPKLLENNTSLLTLVWIGSRVSDNAEELYSIRNALTANSTLKYLRLHQG